MTQGNSRVRSLPSVDKVLKEDTVKSWLARHARSIVVRAVREAIDEKRVFLLTGAHKTGADEALPVMEEVLALAALKLEALASYRLRPVINATGIVIHTNLGRAPLCQGALQNVTRVASGYSNLEYDLAGGKRGKRFVHVLDGIKRLTGAGDAMVVNNNAAAVLICLSVLAYGKEVLVSRGELVEIGGSFRIPDIVAAGGAILKEVGTTNKTHPGDYERAITSETAMVLKVHQSNFRISGFTEEVSIGALAELAHHYGIPVAFDLGSGCLIDLKPLGVFGEPSVREVLKAGVDLVTFSGDKLLGGPQCGIIAGAERYVEPLRKHPLSRAMRVDKFTLSALEATLMEYDDEDNEALRAKKSIPVIRMLFQDKSDIKKRAVRLASGLRRLGGGSVALFEIAVVEGVSQAGGGSLPGVELPTFAVAISCENMSADSLQASFRAATHPVIGRIKDGRYLLDALTISDNEIKPLIAAFKGLLQK